MKEMNEEELNKLNVQLKEIYKEEPHIFPELDSESPDIPEKDFETCKRQLLALLTYIEELNPEKLDLFSKYKANVNKLTIESAKPDILITLRSAKTTLERSLPTILSGHEQADKAALNDLTVTLCYSGANANLEHALGYLSQKTSLSDAVHLAKRSLLFSLAKDFLGTRGLVEYEGNEVHYANALFNYVASDYGLSEQKDLFAPDFPPELLHEFRQVVVKEQLDVAALVRVLPQFLPTLLPVNITQLSEFETLSDFFQCLGEKKPGFEHYQLLYTDEDIDDVPTYVPKEGWEILIAAVIADYLEKAGYISETQITIEDKKLLNNGEHIIDASNGTFALLKDKDSTYLSKILLQNPNMPVPDVWRIIKQIPTVSLLELYSSTEPKEEMTHIRNYCFYGLLERPELSIEFVEYLSRKINVAFPCPEIEAQQRALACYVFNSGYQCSAEILDFLVTKLSKDQQYNFLMRAATNNNVNFVNCFLYHEPTFVWWESLLLAAVVHTSTEVLTTLQQHGANLNQKICHIHWCQGNAPAHIATELGCIEVLDTLGALGVNLDGENHFGLTPACIAAIKNNSDALIALHRLGADLSRRVLFYGSNECLDYQGRAPVHIVAALGHTQVLHTLAHLGINLNVADDSGLTPACIAVIKGKLDVLDALHQLGANLNISATRGQLFSAPHVYAGSAPVHIAITVNKKDVLQKLKDLGYSLDEYNQQGDTPACMAVYTNNILMLRALHELGVDLNKPNAKGLTPACLAAKSGNLQILRELKTLKIDLNKTGSTGATPFYTAAEYGRSDSIRTLHALKADFNIPNEEGQTPAFIAAQKGHCKVLKWLKVYGADLTTPNHQGDTPVYIAIVSGQVGVLNTLQSLGVDLSHIMERGDEVWRIAAKKQDIKMLCKLIEIGVNPKKEAISVMNLSSQSIEKFLLSAINCDNLCLLQDLLDLLTCPISPDLVFYAAQYARSPSILLALNKHSAILDYSDLLANSSIHIAAREGNVHSLSVLMQLGADLTEENGVGETVAFIAAKTGQYSIIEQLIDREEVYQSIHISKTDLLYGLKKCEQDVLTRAEHKIAERVAAGDKPNKLILFPRDIAEIMGHNDIVMLLEQHRLQPKIVPRVSSPSFFAEQDRHNLISRPNSPIPRPAAPIPWACSSVEPMSVDGEELSEDGLSQKANSSKRRSAAAFLGGGTTKKPKAHNPLNPEEEHAFGPR